MNHKAALVVAIILFALFYWLVLAETHGLVGALAIMVILVVIGAIAFVLRLLNIL